MISYCGFCFYLLLFIQKIINVRTFPSSRKSIIIGKIAVTTRVTPQRQHSFPPFSCNNPSTYENPTNDSFEILKTPSTLSDMMINAAQGILESKKAGIPLICIDIPLPVTGGTEIDDWPGGIRQKYFTLAPLLKETMRALSFSANAMNKKEFLGDYGEEDSVGIWEDNGYQICCFATPDSIPYLQKKLKWTDNSTTLALFNHQIFLNAFSKEDSKKFVNSLHVAYQLTSMSLKGPRALSVRGLLYRKYPEPFKAARRLEDGSYIVLKTYETKPSQTELDELFYNDSKERDSSISFLDGIKKQIPNFNI